MNIPSQSTIEIIGRKRISTEMDILFNVMSFGILYALCRISLTYEIRIKTSPCSLEEADCVVVRDQYDNKILVNVIRKKIKQTLTLKRYMKNGTVRYINIPCGRFIYDYHLDKFVLPNFIFNGKSFEELYQERFLLPHNEESNILYEKRIIFGLNNSCLKIDSITEIILNNIIEPFFIWEVFSFVTWIAIEYYKYAMVVGPIYLIMLIINLVDGFKNRNMMIRDLKISQVRVLREGAFRSISEHDVLPGDIVYIDNTENFTCDVEILKGNVITDESFLTGESIPICKGIGSAVYSGTKVIKSTSTSITLNSSRLEKLVKVKNLTKKERNVEETTSVSSRYYHEFEDLAIGIVTKTGMRTRRNTLMCNLNMKNLSVNEFSKQSAVIVKYLITGALLLMILFIIILSKSLSLGTNLEYSVDVALTFFSPALYTCLQLGAQYARGQLLKKKINTTDVSRINTAGEVDMIVFDKTGTLTELGVDILCFDTIKRSYEKIDDIGIVARMALSTCHYVIELENQYSGDILDMKMFLFSQSKIINKDDKRYVEMEVVNRYQPVCKEYTGKEDDCTLFLNAENSSSSNSNEMCPEDTLEILRIYDFDIYLKRISVIVKTHDGRRYLFCKGAPDSVKRILNDLPEEYDEKVRDYGLEGYRVLTVGYKEIGDYESRETDESGLSFLGFLVFANKLKDETCDVIKELREAELNPKMCTGDNILTAISVAKECGMIDKSTPVLFPVLEEGCKSVYDVDWFCVADEEYIFDKIKMQLYYEINRSAASEFVVAVEGKEFEYFKSSNYHTFILEKGVVFARFNPDNKKDLIEEYSKNGYVTMFCGDGANDTGALCSADVGVSLATNEASLAATFNSKNLTSVLDVVKEGRSALSMSAAQFKYIFYSQVLAGFQMLSLLPQLFFPADRMSLVNDLMSCYVLAYALSNFKAANKIFPKKISIDLSVESLYLFIELLLILAVFSATSWSISNFKPVTENSIILESKNSAVIFVCTMVLLVYRSLKFAQFGPHRESLRTNKLFISIFIACSTVSAVVIYLIFTSNPNALEFFKTVKLLDSDKTKCLLCLLATIGITIIFDLFEKKSTASKYG